MLNISELCERGGYYVRVNDTRGDRVDGPFGTLGAAMGFWDTLGVIRGVTLIDAGTIRIC
jgi:hypothetical protein